MKKEVFNQIVVDNIDSKLISVILSSGIKLSQELEIEGNRTTRTSVKFIKIEDTYVGIRKHTDVTYDYSGQISKGDSRNADFYMGYDEIVALEFYDEVAKQIEDGKAAEGKHEIISKPKGKYAPKESGKKKAVEEEEAAAGFAVHSLSDYDYYVYNKSMDNSDAAVFDGYLGMLVKLDYCEKHDLDLNEFMEASYKEITHDEYVLGKDSTQNFWYCYVLVILIFMLIIMYGMSIASSVTNEKSNRSIEILVTSTDSTALLFGKVFAGAVATVFQVGIIAVCLLGSYQYNKDFWGIDLGMFLDIPANVLVVFAVFGIGGFLFYAFLYGALGALVSKIEDLNKSAGSAQMIIMIVYFVVLLQLDKVDGVPMKVCSFLPFSSYSAMFARVAMGHVQTWEIIVSAVILYISVALMGVIGGKIFRSSTLRYGNPIKLTTAIKNLRKKDS